MLDIKLIRQDPEFVKKGVKDKGNDPNLVDQIIELDLKRRNLIQEIGDIRHKKTEAENKLIKEGKDENALKILKEVKVFLSEKEESLKQYELDLEKAMTQLPNLPLKDVPVGLSGEDNVVLREVGKKPNFSFKPLDYLTLGESLDIIDVKRASKTSGSRFGFLKNQAAVLEFALINYALSVIIKKGFTPIVPPVMIKPDLFKGMGYMDQSDEEMYHLSQDELYLVGTSEQIVGPMHTDEVFDKDDLPKRYVSFSSCFRREAGSYGKDTKGILRVHQFDKLEMLVFSLPEESEKEQQLILKIEEELMKGLNLPYRVIRTCSADLSQPSASSYDIETWLPSENMYRETHSNSNCTDFQTRRLNIKYKDKKTGETYCAHLLNGTAFAIGRMIIAILENYQLKDGSVSIPKVLWPYSFGIKVIKKI